MKNLIILGSTGSIGTQSLEVARQNGYSILGLTAGSNAALIEAQAREFMPRAVALADRAAAEDLKIKLRDTDIKVLSGEEGICEIASMNYEATVINAIVGIAGLYPTLCAIKAGHDIALANKETLVTGGELVKAELKRQGVKLLPVDSEHSAIFQCLQGIPKGSLRKILLTASGGPFFGKTKAELENVTVEQALKHPNWSMGTKITIDSATLMNKGLEVIEAMHLFDISVEDIEVLVHRQSIVHSAIELSDGAVIAQMGTPDMKLPIQYALTYPQRAALCGERLNLFEVGALTFEKPDLQTFGCLKTCISAGRAGGLKPTAANGANEEAVKLFLEGKIKFLQIAELVEAAADNQAAAGKFSVEDVFAADKAARALVRKTVL